MAAIADLVEGGGAGSAHFNPTARAISIEAADASTSRPILLATAQGDGGVRVEAGILLLARRNDLSDGQIREADWDHQGRLLVATRAGHLEMRDAADPALPVLVDHDLSLVEPSPQPAPAWARTW